MRGKGRPFRATSDWKGRIYRSPSFQSFLCLVTANLRQGISFYIIIQPNEKVCYFVQNKVGCLLLPGKEDGNMNKTFCAATMSATP